MKTSNMSRYMHKVYEIPAEHQALFRNINSQIAKAFIKWVNGVEQITQSPIKGDYFYVNSEGELVEISRWTNEDTGERGYIVKEYNDGWNSDPYPTLKAAKKGLGL